MTSWKPTLYIHVHVPVACIVTESDNYGIGNCTASHVYTYIIHYRGNDGMNIQVLVLLS